MTSRAELEKERASLQLLLNHTKIQIGSGYDGSLWLERREALTTSIARLDVLLRLSDEQISSLVEVLLEGVGSPPHTEWEHSRILVADLIRRTS